MFIRLQHNIGLRIFNMLGAFKVREYRSPYANALVSAYMLITPNIELPTYSVQILGACTEDYIVQNLAPANWGSAYIAHRDLVLQYHLLSISSMTANPVSTPRCPVVASRSRLSRAISIRSTWSGAHTMHSRFRAYMNEASDKLEQLFINLLGLGAVA